MNPIEYLTEFIRLLNFHDVKYLVVKAYAVGKYRHPPNTDIGFWIEPTKENAERILTVLNELEFSSLIMRIKYFTKENSVIQLGYEPLRIDIVPDHTGLPSLTFSECWPNRVISELLGQKVNFIGNNKKSTGINMMKQIRKIFLRSK